MNHDLQRPGLQARIGTWPGRSFQDNVFISLFCDCLSLQGYEVVEIKSIRHVNKQNLDVLIVHWLEQIFWVKAPRWKQALLAVLVIKMLLNAKMRGIKTIWVVHNLEPHNATKFQKLIWSVYAPVAARTVDAAVTLSPATLPAIKSAFRFRRNTIFEWFPHPAYPCPDTVAATEKARDFWKLPQDRTIWIFVGAVKPYKGILALARKIAREKDGPLLFVAGPVAPEIEADFRNLAAGSNNLLTVARRLSDTEFEMAIRAADYVVLPFEKSLHSGSIIHALSLKKPVLTTMTPYAVDLSRAVGQGWIAPVPEVLDDHIMTRSRQNMSLAPDLSTLSIQCAGLKLRSIITQLQNSVSKGCS